MPIGYVGYVGYNNKLPYMGGGVGWCLGAYSEVDNTYVHHLHTFLHTGSGLYKTLYLQHPRIVSRPYILYNTLQSTALQQFYSLQPLQHHPYMATYCCNRRN